MAQSQAQASTPPAFRLSQDSQESLVYYCGLVLDAHKKMNDYRTKLEWIDCNYALHKTENTAVRPGEEGVDRSHAASQPCGINLNDITVPIVISQVDTYVGYFTDIYLSGFPLFPVVSTYQNRTAAEQLEAIIDEHSVRGRYARHMLMNFRNAAKYNISAIDLDWEPLDMYNVVDALTELRGGDKASRLKQAAYYYNSLKNIDMYNALWDYRKNPVDVPYEGDYAGHISLMTRMALKKLLLYYGSTGDGYNTTQALNSTFGKGNKDVSSFEYYTDKPDIQYLISNKELWRNGFDWEHYLEGKQQGSRSARSYTDIYEHIKLYIRLIPKEHGMHTVPDKGTPQVWKCCFVNHNKLVYAKRLYTLYDMLPMFFSQPFEDDFGMQTKGIGERAIPFQEASSSLLSIRFNSARRAVSDRAIYDPTMLNSSDVNAPYPAPKIPIRDGKTLAGKKLEDAYKAIPFDSRGTETVIQDMGQVVTMADRMQGINQGIQGQHVKGNKTRKQWDDTQEGAQNRMRLPALAIEYQLMLPVKEQIKLNIYQYGVEGIFQSQTTGEAYSINRAALDNIRKVINQFKIGDGFHPAEKLASSDVLEQGMLMLGQNPVLAQALGALTPQIWIHLMSLGGVKGLEQYLPQIQANQAAAPPPTAQPAPAASGTPAT